MVVQAILGGKGGPDGPPMRGRIRSRGVDVPPRWSALDTPDGAGGRWLASLRRVTAPRSPARASQNQPGLSLECHGETHPSAYPPAYPRAIETVPIPRPPSRAPRPHSGHFHIVARS